MLTLYGVNIPKYNDPTFIGGGQDFMASPSSFPVLKARFFYPTVRIQGGIQGVG